MKVRLGFVSNSSSTCVICGNWMSEESDRRVCDDCFESQIRDDALGFARWICTKKKLDYAKLHREYEDEKLKEQAAWADTDGLECFVECPKCKEMVVYNPEGGTTWCKCGTPIPPRGYQFHQNGVRDD